MAGPPGEPGHSWRSAVPAALLVTVALGQIVLARTVDLSPWKGGGFGMFATLDGTASRYVPPLRDDEMGV